MNIINKVTGQFSQVITYDPVTGEITGFDPIGNVNLGPVSNLSITGGTAGQVLSTDGAGGLSFIASSGGYSNTDVSNYLDGNITTNIIPSTATQSLGSLANPWNELFISGNTIYVAGVPLSLGANTALEFNGVPLVQSSGDTNIDTTGNIQAAEITANGNIVANSGFFFIGDGGLLSNIATGTNYSNANVAAYLPTYTGNLDSVGDIGSSGNINAVGEITSFANVVAAPGAFFIGDGGPLSNIAAANVVGTVASATVAASANSVAGSNVTGQVAFAATANTVAGANVIGTVASATVAASANTVAGANVTGTVASATVAASANSVAGANVTGTVANATFATTAAEATNAITATVATTAHSVAGANVTGAVAFATTANTVAGANVTGTVASATVAASANTVAGANVTGQVAFAATANAVAGANVSGAVAFATTANAVAGANVSGTVANANYAAYAGNVTIAAQSNITSVGTLTSLTVSGNASAGNVAAGNVLTANFVTGTLTTAAQPNVTSVGTLSSLTVSGNATVQSNVITDNIISRTGDVTISASGTNQSITLTPTGTGVVDVSGFRVTDLALPSTSTDAATKGYVDSVAEGLNVKEGCTAATPADLATLTSNIVTYDNGTAGVGATLTLSTALTTLDGVTLANGNRILVKNEATSEWNGIYTWATGGLVLTRAVDYDTPADISAGSFVFISSGTLYAGTGWVETDVITTIGTSSIDFTQFSGAGSYSAGAGLTLTGTQFSVTNTAVTAGTYGNASQTTTFTVNSRGQLTAASQQAVIANAATLSGTALNNSVLTSNLTSLGTLTGLDVNGNALITRNLEVDGNAGVVGNLISSHFIGEGGNLSNITAANITGTVANANYAAYAGNVTIAAQPNITSVGTLVNLTVNSGNTVSIRGGNTTSIVLDSANGYVSINQNANIDIFGNITTPSDVTAFNMYASNMIADVMGNATTVLFGDGANITGLPAGYANSDVANYLASNANVVVTTTGNITTTANISGSYIKGNGSQLTSITGANVTGTVASATVAASANAVAGANVTGQVSFAATANSVAGANVSGTVASATVAASANSVAGANVTGTVASATVAASANSVAGANVTGAVAFATTANSVAGANVSGTVASATVAASANAVAGANVTGTVASATVAASANSVAVANVSGIGNIATINLNGSTTQVLAGNGAWITAAGAYGNANVATYLASNANVVITTTGNITTTANASANNFVAANTVVVSGTAGTGNIIGANNVSAINFIASGNLAVAGNADLGAVGNITISGGTNGQVLTTDGAGDLSWSTVSSGGVQSIIANGTSNVSIAASAGNITMAVNGNSAFNVSDSGIVSVGVAAQSVSGNTGGIAIGYQAGYGGQLASGAIALGWNAAFLQAQQTNAIAIGSFAGFGNVFGGLTQGANSIAIGTNAARNGSAGNTIIINATGANLNGVTSQTDSFYVAPIRNDTGNTTNVVYYNTTTKEVTYGPGVASYGNANVATYLASNANVVITTTGNITTTANASANNFVAAGNVVVTGTAGTGNIIGANNVSAINFIASGNLTVAGNTNLGAVANVTITGGTTGQVLTTDGSGDLSWTTPASTYGNTEVAAYLPTYAGNLSNVSSVGNASTVLFGDGSNITGLPATYTDTDVSLYLASGTDSDGYTTTGNITTTANIAANNLSVTANIASANNITAVGNISANGNIIVNGTAGTGNIIGANNVSAINFIASGDLTVAGNTNLGAVANVTITGGTTGQVLTTDGAGDLSWTVTPIIANGTSNVSIASAAGPITMSYAGNVMANLTSTKIALGQNAGVSQGANAIAIGASAGNASQSTYSIAIGANAAAVSQGTNAIAIGQLSGNNNQNANAVAIGFNAGTGFQAGNSVAIGVDASSFNQGINAVSVGGFAATYNQATGAVAVGANAAYSNQGEKSVAIGYNAGSGFQGNTSIAIGSSAANSNQGIASIAIGVGAGASAQGNSAIAIGIGAGASSQGANSVAIGKLAGNSIQIEGSITINASGVDLPAAGNGLYINPVRNDTGNVTNVIYYNTSTKEVTYGPSSGPTGISRSVVSSNITLALNQAGTFLYSTATAAQTVIIPTNATVAFAVGTTINVVLNGTGSVALTPDSGVSLYLAGNATSATRTVSPYGIATLLQVATDVWFVNGTGVY
jgi:hypothetical protein